MKSLFVITRDANDVIDGVRRDGRVYVTGPHFGETDIFSSTEDPAQATRYAREEAERHVNYPRRSWKNARIEPYDSASAAPVAPTDSNAHRDADQP